MTAEALVRPYIQSRTCQAELLNLAHRLCSAKLGTIALNMPTNRYDEEELRSYMYRSPIDRGLVVVSRYVGPLRAPGGVAIVTYDFVGSDFPLRMQVRADHLPQYYENEFYEDRIKEISQYVHKPAEYFAQALPLGDPARIKV